MHCILFPWTQCLQFFWLVYTANDLIFIPFKLWIIIITKESSAVCCVTGWTAETCINLTFHINLAKQSVRYVLASPHEKRWSVSSGIPYSTHNSVLSRVNKWHPFMQIKRDFDGKIVIGCDASSPFTWISSSGLPVVSSLLLLLIPQWEAVLFNCKRRWTDGWSQITRV